MGPFFIADTLFDDENAIKYYRRPFKDVDDMNDVLISNILEKLDCNANKPYYPSPKDPFKLFMLGDIGNPEYVYRLIDKLNAQELWTTITIIKGDTDSDSYVYTNDYGIDYIKYPIIYDNCILSHEPIPYIPQESYFLNIHGHTHSLRYGNGGGWFEGNRYYNVSVDSTGYRPVSLERIRKELFLS